MLFWFESSAHALGSVSFVASFITIDEQLHSNGGWYFPTAGYGF